MEMKKTIQLPNRDGDKNYLKFLYKGGAERNIIYYKLNLEYDDFGIRVGYSNSTYNNDNIMFIDPSGGPFMEVDKFKIGDLLLKEILFVETVKEKGFVLGFVEDK